MKIIKTTIIEVSEKKLKEMYQEDVQFDKDLGGDGDIFTYEEWVEDWIETAEFGIEDEEIKITENTIVEED